MIKHSHFLAASEKFKQIAASSIKKLIEKELELKAKIRRASNEFVARKVGWIERERLKQAPRQFNQGDEAPPRFCAS
jgi:hypothetical protein